MDRMDEKEQDTLQLMFAECVYASGISFNAITNKRWLDFFHRLRPQFEVPTSHQLSNDLLDKVHKRVESMANVYLENSQFISLVVDGWTNVRDDAIINIVALTPSPVFMKSIDTKGVTKDAHYMQRELNKIIEDIDEQKPKKVTGLISDNENKMKALGAMV